MMKTLLLLSLLLPSVTLAEISVKVTPATVQVQESVTTVTQLIGEDTKPLGDPTTTTGSLVDKGTAPAATMLVATTQGSMEVMLSSVTSDTATATKLSPGNYVVYQPGTHEFLVQVINLENFIWETKKVIVAVSKPVPPTPPTPPKPPTPDVPGDEFNNLGQRVAVWCAGLSKNEELSVVYQRGIDRLLSDPSSTITNIGNDMNVAAVAVRGNDVSYNSFVSGINTELAARWPMSRTTYADFLSSIVAGLKGAK